MRKADTGESLADLLDQLPEDLARQAFTHASWVGHRAESYERLAFLGDVVLSLAVSTHLFPRFERYGAGRLTKVRAQAVSGASCAAVALELDVPERLRAQAPEGAGGPSFDMLAASERVLASVCEAVIGAAYLAFGLERVAPAVVAAFDEASRARWSTPWTTSRCSRSAWPAGPRWWPTGSSSEQGPAHDRRFQAVAECDGRGAGPRGGAHQEERRAGGRDAGARRRRDA